MNLTESKTEWVKFGNVQNICIVGRETICITGGCDMVLININTKEETQYRANHPLVGDGIRCVAGHKTLNVLAFAEKCINPRFFVRTCPEFKEICTVEDGSDDEYLSMVFTEADFLITLSDLPSYTMTIWNWRNGEKITSEKTKMVGKGQMLKCSYASPVTLAQLVVQTNRLNVWDILMCGKRCLTTVHEIIAPREAGLFTSILWTSEGSFFVLDDNGHVFMMNAEYALELAIKWENSGDKPTSFVWYKAGLAIAGPSSEIKHYKKSGRWICDWTVKTPVAVVNLLNTPRDYLIGVTERGDVALFDAQSGTFNALKQHESKFDNVCLIYPLGEFIVTLAQKSELTVWKVSTGQMIDTMKLEGVALTIAQHQEYPYFGVAFEHGLLQIFSFYEDCTIQLVTSFLLTRNPLNSIRFFETGLFVVADLTQGDIFVIEGVPGTKMRVVANVRSYCQIADYILVASKTCFRLFVLKVTSNKYIAGTTIGRFCLIRGMPCPDEKEYTAHDGRTLYERLYATTKDNRDRVFLATSSMSKRLHELETKRGELTARLINKVKTGHQMGKFYYQFDKNHTISYGYDGLVIIRTIQMQEKAIIMPHHRMDGGIVKAYIDPFGKYIVSLGRNNVLICTSLVNVKESDEKYTEIHELFKDPKLTLMFSHPTTGFMPTGEYEGKTWIEVCKMKQEEYEKNICLKNRKNIRMTYKEVRKEVSELLTQNLTGPENEYLDIQDFNLDSNLKEQKMIECKEKCKSTKQYLEALIVAQDKVSRFIKEYCWDKMSLQGRSIYSMFSNFYVDSYVLLPADVNQDAVLNYIEEHRNIEAMMANDEIFEPWVPKTPSQVRLHLQKNPKIEEIAPQRPLKGEDDDSDGTEKSEEEEKIDAETVTAFTGSVTHEFITLNYGHYLQHQIQSFLQTEYQTILSRIENIKLRESLNKDFDFLMSLKVREVNNVKERNTRLRHIISEINYFSHEQMDITIVDPNWRQEEDPAKILEVTDDELSVTPYISPSQQAILDAQAAEAERIRLLLLADDFKERALMAMMNGVLEVRWEDELRKNVAVPKCVLEKKPEDFREDDLRAIKDYEEKLKFLESERERYKRMLTAEYGNVANNLRDAVRKFNSRVDDLMLHKIKIDSAITQENLKINRLRLRNFKRNVMNEREKQALKAIAANEKQIDEIQKLITSLTDTLNECRGSLDALQSKEKLLDKAFRRDLLESSPAAQEIAQRQYKRRPKSNIRGITSTTILLELSRCVVSHERTLILIQEALDFLKAMDTLDLYIGIPNALDEHVYITVCRHRRFKIESEIKIKAATMDIAEGEATIIYYQKILAFKKDLAHNLTADLANIRTEKIKQAEDIELQLVIKEGYVEVNRSGEIKDFDDAIMVSRKDIQDINKVIVKGGNRKLKAMRDTMNFRRGILTMEWQHKKLRMQIEDLEEYIQDIKSVKVTKEIQSYLKSRARGDSPDKGLTFEQEVELVKQSYQRIIDERKEMVKELQQKINTIKRNNKKLDKDICDVNVDVCECKLDIDEEVVQKEKDILKIRMATLLKRAKLVKQIQVNHNEILVLQTELELLRLKTYPTLKYKIFN